MLAPSPLAPRRSGAAAVEFALILPLLVLILFGILEVGRMVNVQLALRNAVREGAAQASSGSKTNTQVGTIVQQYVTQAGLPGSKVTVAVSNESSSNTDVSKAKKNDVLKVHASVLLKDVSWLPARFLNSEDS